MVGDPIEFPNVSDILYPDTDNVLWPGSPAPRPMNFVSAAPSARTTTVLGIWNRALAAIGTRSTVAGLNEDSNEARNCAILYDGVRDQLLQAARWNFARGMLRLTLLKAAPGTPENPVTSATPTQWNATMPQIPWLYSYAYPAECIQLQRIPLQQTVWNGDVPLTTTPNGIMYGASQSPIASARFEVAQDVDPLTGTPIRNILTNVCQAVGVFTRETTDPNMFDGTFTEGLVQALAGKLAIALTGDKTMEKNKYAIADGIIREARASDGNEGTPQSDNLPDWIRVRSGGYGYGDGLNNYGILCEPYGPTFGG